MLHRRLLEALDSSAPLLLLEAMRGGGKRTVLRQWEHRGGDSDGELRLLVDAHRFPAEAEGVHALLRTVLRHRLAAVLPDVDLSGTPPSSAAESEVLALLRELRRPVVLAVHEAERLSTQALTALLDLLEHGVRVLLAGSDLTEAMDEATSRGHYFGLIGDQELWLTRWEVRALLAEQGIELAEEALTALMDGTLGHPGSILLALATMGHEVETGSLTRERVLSAYYTEHPVQDSAATFSRFLQRAAMLPRFTAAEAQALAGDRPVHRDLGRLDVLGMGRMIWHPGLRERVFRWDEGSRHEVLRSMTVLPEDEDGAVFARVRAAAEAQGDQELLVSMMLASGEVDAAEERLREQIWDLLPNALAPMWMPLMRTSPADLVSHPALLAARLRIGAGRARSPVAVLAVRNTMKRLAEDQGCGNPWARVGQLIHAVHNALFVGDREAVIDLYTRVRSLIGDLMSSAAIEGLEPRHVSELMFLSDTVFRSGNALPAGEIARFAARAIELDPARMDPSGERLDAARRMILHDHRARGVEDVLEPTPLLARSQFLRHDGDRVVAAMALMWERLDAGDFEAAAAHLRAVSDSLAVPEAFPVLQLMRAHLAVFRRASEELVVSISAFERGTLAVPRQGENETHQQMRRITDYLSRFVGRPLPSPGYLPVVPAPPPAPGRPHYPRTEFTVLIMEALYALRDGHVPASRAALAKAAVLTARRPLGLYTLAHASPEEVQELAEIAQDVPGGDSLGLEGAVGIAGALDEPRTDLSEREREVLRHLRAGVTNPQMAEAMFVSVNTVKFHRANLMRKVGASSRDELLAAADARGL